MKYPVFKPTTDVDEKYITMIIGVKHITISNNVFQSFDDVAAVLANHSPALCDVGSLPSVSHSNQSLLSWQNPSSEMGYSSLPVPATAASG